VSEIQFDQIRTFLRALKKTPDEIRLRAFYPAGHQFKGGDSGRKGPPKAQTIEQWQSEGRGVYVVINTGGDTDSAITSCCAVFCEWDDRPKDWQVTAWQHLGLPEPTIQVDTGGKSIHTYWCFDQPIPVDQWRSLQKRLLEHSDADRSLKNPSRVMRLPGTHHMSADGTSGGIAAIIHQTDHYYTPQVLEHCLPDEQTHDHLIKARQATGAFAHTITEIEQALACIPPRKPGTGTYQIYRNVLWGLIHAINEAGGNDGQAIDLMLRHSPHFTEAHQVADSGGEHINSGTFYYWAKHYGWQPPRIVPQVVVDHPETSIIPSGQRLAKLEANELLDQLREAANLRYNVFTQQIERSGKPLEGAEFYYLEIAERGCKIAKEVAMDCLVKIAKDNPYDPIQNYLNWAATNKEPAYIDRLASTYLRPQDAALPTPTLYDEMMRCTLIAAVKRAFAPGSKHDCATVLMGEQGARKSSFWAALGGEFFSDALRDIKSKDDLLVLHMSWIMEWAELDHLTGKQHAGNVKAFLSQSTDMLRVPYGKSVEHFKRRGIIVGSTNRDSGFLVDETGNRRFWVIPVTCTLENPINVSGLLAERDEIWSAAVAAYRRDEPSALSLESEALVAQENADYLVESPWRSPIAAWLATPHNQLKDITTDLLLTEAIERPLERQTRFDQQQVGTILRDLGYSRKKRRVGNCLKWVYSRD
jgi:predicted P-loop ATPase